VRYGPGIQPLLAILAGIISLAVWLTRLDRFFVFIPSAVMHGFTLGVAFIIALNQLNFIFGLPKLPRHEGCVRARRRARRRPPALSALLLTRACRLPPSCPAHS